MIQILNTDTDFEILDTDRLLNKNNDFDLFFFSVPFKIKDVKKTLNEGRSRVVEKPPPILTTPELISRSENNINGVYVNTR